MNPIDPDRLALWEKVLQSDVAVALLLLAGLMVMCAYLVTALHSERKRNDELQLEFRGYLKNAAAFDSLIGVVKGIIDLSRDTYERSDVVDPPSRPGSPRPEDPAGEQ